jgi:hypothetical protein
MGFDPSKDGGDGKSGCGDDDDADENFVGLEGVTGNSD